MKRIKSILGTVMALTIAVSCTLVASATEVSKDFGNCKEVNQSIIMDTNSKITPYAIQALSDVIEIGSQSAGYTATGELFNTWNPTYSYITLALSTNASGCTVTLSGIVNETVYYPAGTKYLTIANARNGRIHYSIRFHSSMTAAAFQFMGTDSRY